VSARVVPVALLTSYIRELFDGDPLLADVWVEGEVAETFVSRAGHVYFTLRDTNSQLKCVMFKGFAQRQCLLPKAGDQVAAHGRVSVYERDGAYQLYVDAVQPAGLGILALQRELLRQQLAAEGLFDPARKRPLPPFPRWIGVVTSPEGAVWHDIQIVLRRRYPLAHLILSPSPVQGDAAPEGIVRALQRLQDDGRAEVIIVARGGGSAEDLSCFDDERVVRAVFACRVPVISAVGHETDWTLIDEVADLRAPTPSAAAEMCSPSIVDLAERVVALQIQARNAAMARVESERDRFERLNASLRHNSPGRTLPAVRTRIALARQRLDEQQRRLLSDGRAAVASQCSRLHQAIRADLNRRQERVRLRRAVLAALEPERVLGRGYAILTGEGGQPIVRVMDVSAGQAIAARLADGVVAARVTGADRQPLRAAEVAHG